jgi:hypothetical protein
MTKRHPRPKRQPVLEAIRIVPIFFLPCDAPYVLSGLEAIAENGDAPDYVKECMSQIFGQHGQYVVERIQVFPIPAGYRLGDAILRVSE